MAERAQPVPVALLDCTLRDGGYYNKWDFDRETVDAYLRAMADLSTDYVELGFRSLHGTGFMGPFAYTTDHFVRQLQVPAGLKLGAMINASELVQHPDGVIAALRRMVSPAAESPISLIRIAAHIGDVAAVLPGCGWLKEQGYTVGLNLMQIAGRDPKEIEGVGRCVSSVPIDVLYFADSMGSLDPDGTGELIEMLRSRWGGPLGIHTHDNLNLALANTLRAMDQGVTWVDGTVTGMGRGAGNAKTEYLAIEVAERRGVPPHISPLLTLIARYFKPLQELHGWGSNAFYFLAGKYGIHPTFIQEMLANPRFDGVDLLAVIDYLRQEGGKSYNVDALDRGLNFFKSDSKSNWRPSSVIAGREVMLIGPGSGAARHRDSLEDYIRRRHPLVLALNTVTTIAGDLIDFRVASHPIRLLEDGPTHLSLAQPLVTPASQLPDSVRWALRGKALLDFGLVVNRDTFAFEETRCVIPASIVVAYALAIAASGRASRVLLAGFDGYSSDDTRSIEMNRIFELYKNARGAPELLAVTPSLYRLPTSSIHLLNAEL